VKGATLSGTNVYGTLAGANTAAVTTLTASGMVQGATLAGTNVYGTLAGANTAAVTTLTASGMVQGATLSGTNVYGTLAGANTAAVTSLTASGMVKGATLSGTNVYGTLAGANTAAVTTLTASGMVQGATLAGTNIYGTLAGANTATVTTIYGTLAGANTATVTSLTAGTTSAATDGVPLTLNTGEGDVYFEYNTNDRANETSAGITIRTSVNPTLDSMFAVRSSGHASRLWVGQELTSVGANKLCAGYGGSNGGEGVIASYNFVVNTNGDTGIGTTSPAEKLHVVGNATITGGLITNTGQVTKKTYSFTGVLVNGQSIGNSTIKITFSPHVFYAKIVAHLIESDNEVSTLSMECGGGHRDGGTPLVITTGPTSVFGNTSTNPWNSVVVATTTTVAFAPTTNMTNSSGGNYNVFIEYISAHASGAVTNIIEGSSTQITFGY
jgi:hypothetical protein